MATSDGDGERRLDRFRHTSLDGEAPKHAFPLPLRCPLSVCISIHDRTCQRETRVVVGVNQQRRFGHRHRRVHLENCRLHKLSVIRLCNETNQLLRTRVHEHINEMMIVLHMSVHLFTCKSKQSNDIKSVHSIYLTKSFLSSSVADTSVKSKKIYQITSVS